MLLAREAFTELNATDEVKYKFCKVENILKRNKCVVFYRIQDTARSCTYTQNYKKFVVIKYCSVYILFRLSM
jgi:hypothetical protein